MSGDKNLFMANLLLTTKKTDQVLSLCLIRGNA